MNRPHCIYSASTCLARFETLDQAKAWMFLLRNALTLRNINYTRIRIEDRIEHCIRLEDGLQYYYQPQDQNKDPKFTTYSFQIMGNPKIYTI